MHRIKDIANAIEMDFWLTGHKWKINGDLVAPTNEEIYQTLKQMRQRLADEKAGATMELGGIIMMKSNTGYETYVKLGEINL